MASSSSSVRIFGEHWNWAHSMLAVHTVQETVCSRLYCPRPISGVLQALLTGPLLFINYLLLLGNIFIFVNSSNLFLLLYFMQMTHNYIFYTPQTFSSCPFLTSCLQAIITWLNLNDNKSHVVLISSEDHLHKVYWPHTCSHPASLAPSSSAY